MSESAEMFKKLASGRLKSAQAKEEAKATIEAMDKWLPDLKRLANG